jgi:MSHA pilin protein MshD
MNAPVRAGFTVIEGAIASIVLGLLVGAVANSVSAAAASRQRLADNSRGALLAEDLMTEIVQLDYAEPSNFSAPLGTDSGEVSGSSRALFDDVDDYHGLVESPPRAQDGTVISGLSGWTRQTTVKWATVADPTTDSSTETTIKRITVTVKRGNRTVGTSVWIRTGAWSKAVRTNKAVVSVGLSVSLTPN